MRIRPLSAADLHTHADGCDDEVNRWSNEGHVSTRAQHLAWLERNATAWQDQDVVVDLAIESVDTSAHIGVVGIQRGLPYLRPGEVNLTYALYGGQRGHGFATRAVRVAMRIALAQEPVAAFLIRCAADNARSAALARRLGFTYLGEVREETESFDRYVNRT